LEAKKVPESLELTRRVAPVRWSVTTTSALLTGLPSVSNSLPRIEDVVLCASAAAENKPSTTMVKALDKPEANLCDMISDLWTVSLSGCVDVDTLKTTERVN
jgi:hypothetical protein